MSPLFAITTEDGLDSVCESRDVAEREVRDLKKICGRVRLFTFEGHDAWHAIDEMQAVFDARKPFGRKGMARLMAAWDVRITL